MDPIVPPPAVPPMFDPEATGPIPVSAQGGPPWWSRRPSWWPRARPYVLRLGLPLGAVLLVMMVANSWLRCGWGDCPSMDRLRAYQPGKASRLLDRRGRPLGELRPVEGATVPLRQIPKHVQDAFLAIEDQRFYDHDGVDWRRVLGAALANVRKGGVEQGSSTITMQLARNVFPDRLPAREQTLRRKIAEARVAFEIEDRFQKPEILELYLSHIYFGNGARGVEAAARHYFDTQVARLSVPQAALLAALPKGPAVYDPRRHPERARERRDLVLTLMERQKRLSPAEAVAARKAPLGVTRRKLPAGAVPGLAAFYVEEVRRQLEDRIGERLYLERLTVNTTLDVDLQRPAEEELARQFQGMRADMQGAVVALQPETGDVLAWVGGRDFRASRFDRVKSSQRQAGSAFKPFVYAAALEAGHVLSEHLRDEPFTMTLGPGREWEPKNYDEQYEGVVTMREALVHSKNIPTILLAHEVGPGKVEGVAHTIGITSAIDPTPALALGTVAVSPLELATAYQAFATLGETAVPRLVLSVVSESGEVLWKAEPPVRRRVLDRGTAYLVTHVLQDVVQRGTGTGVRTAGFVGPVAGKTGTTNSATDAWFVGYTPQVVAAVWLGYDKPRPIGRSATGGRLAAPVWGRMMARAQGEKPATAGWTAPAEVVQRWVDAGSGRVLEAGCRPWDGEAYREMFLRRTLPQAGCPDRGDVLEADLAPLPGGEERADRGDDWPGDLDGGSEAAPPDEYEEAESPRRAARRRMEQWARERQEEFERAIREARKDQERRWKERRKREERLREELEEQEKRERKERKKRARERRARFNAAGLPPS